MKKLTKITCLVMAVLLGTLAFASCGTNYTADNTEFFIGATGPLNGENSQYGISVNNGAKLAIQEINANGGLNGIKFKFEMKDDGCAADKAANGYTALYEAGMQISIGSVTSGACASFADAAKEDNVLLMTPSASAAEVIATGDHAFRICFGDPQQGEIAANELTKTYQKIGVIYDTSDTYSTGLYDAFAAQMTALGKAKDTAYIVRTFDAESNKDFSTQVSDLKAAGCDVIFLPIYYTEAALIANKAASVSYNVPIFGCDGLDGIAGKDKDGNALLGAAVTADIKYITPFDVKSTDTKIAKFVADYKAAYGVEPDQFAADGYDAVMVLFEAMKKANVTDVTISASDLSDIVKGVLTSADFTYTGMTGTNMKWTAEGSCEKAPLIVTVTR